VPSQYPQCLTLQKIQYLYTLWSVNDVAAGDLPVTRQIKLQGMYNFFDGNQLWRDRDHFSNYVSTIFRIFGPPPVLCKHVFSTNDNQKLIFSDPHYLPTSANLLYEWSHNFGSAAAPSLTDHKD
jgi:hypothetical protein